MVDWRSDDRELLARILTAEAGNQGPIGMTAAGNVIMNRANTTGYGDGVRGVIMKPGQFSPMNSVLECMPCFRPSPPNGYRAAVR